MDLGAPMLDVAPDVRGRLLQSLAALERPVSRRQIANLAGVAPSNASAVLGSLIEAGLVVETPAGRASLVELNRRHLAAGPIVALAGLRGELVDRIRQRLTEWPDIRGAWIFGSVARGDATSASDIDLLIVADDLDSVDLHERLTELHEDVRQWTGNELQLVEHSERSWRALKSAMNPLVRAIRDEGIPLTIDRTPPVTRQAS